MPTIKSIASKETPSIAEIRTAINGTIDKFKKLLDYKPPKGILERTPSSDKFISKAIPDRPLYPKDVTVHTYSIEEKPVQELASFKQHHNAEGYTCTQEDFNSSGQIARRVTSDKDFNLEEIHEYGYKEGKLISDTSYHTYGNSAWKEVKTINPNGSYSVETIFDKEHIDIKYYNAEHQQTMLTKKYGTWEFSEIYDPKTRKVIGLIRKEDYFTKKCDIDTDTNKIFKFEMNTPEGKTYQMFERNNRGQVTHFILRGRYEYKFDPKTNEASFTDLLTSEVTKTSETTGYRFIRDLKEDKLNIPDNFIKYI